jgi:hypothetical protein
MIHLSDRGLDTISPRFSKFKTNNILDRVGLLDKFVTEANNHTDWSEIHLACLLGLENVVAALCLDDALV